MRKSKLDEEQQEEKRKTTPLIYAAVTAAAVLIVAAIRGIFKASGAADAMRILCDAFFIVGILMGGVGVLSWIGKSGSFDIFSYSTKVILYKFRPKAKLDNYYDYKQKKAEERKPWLKGLAICGVACIILSIVVLLIYNSI